jgi:hypothetical protein
VFKTAIDLRRAGDVVLPMLQRERARKKAGERIQSRCGGSAAARVDQTRKEHVFAPALFSKNLLVSFRNVLLLGSSICCSLRTGP